MVHYALQLADDDCGYAQRGDAHRDEGCATIVVDTNDGESAVHARLRTLVREHNRERKKPPLQLARRPLRLGDVKLLYLDGEARAHTLLLERKTAADWASSITDGRYREQKARFLQAREAALRRQEEQEEQEKQEGQEGCDDAEAPPRMMYVIEGLEPLPFDDGRAIPHALPNKSLKAAVLTTSLRDGLPVVNSRDPGDTAAIAFYLAKRFALGDLASSAAASHSARVCVGAGGGATRKRDALSTPAALLGAMLCQVKGMSVPRADCVVAAFPAAAALVAASAKELAQLRVEGKRRLGPKVAAAIKGVFS